MHFQSLSIKTHHLDYNRIESWDPSSIGQTHPAGPSAAQAASGLRIGSPPGPIPQKHEHKTAKT